MRNRSVLTATFICVLIALGCVAPARANMRCGTYPREIVNYLRAHPGWSIVQFNDLLEEDRTLWNEDHKGQCPGRAIADLDGSGQKSYAMVLQNGGHKSRLEELVVLAHVAGHLEAHVLSRPYQTTVVSVVWRAGPGKTHEWDSKREFFVPHNSFIYERMEASAIQYYFSRGKFQTVQTSD